MSRVRATVRTYLLTALLAAGAAAQPEGASNVGKLPLQRIAPGTVDLNPLYLDTKFNQVDLRAPTSFEGVYRLTSDIRLPGRPARSGEGMFARLSGGMAAVFPRSVYTVRDGVMSADVPAGTVYMTLDRLGAMAARNERKESRAAANAVDLSADVRPRDRSAPRAGEETGNARRTAWDSELQRARRIGALLDEAYRASQAAK